MSDDKVSMVLRQIVSSNNIQSITLKDCHLREKSIDILYKVLETPYPNNL